MKIPDYWMLFNPDGQSTAFIYGAVEGHVHAVTLKDAWRLFIAQMDDLRTSTQRQGWRVLGVAQGDWWDFWEGQRKLAPEVSQSAVDAWAELAWNRWSRENVGGDRASFIAGYLAK